MTNDEASTFVSTAPATGPSHLRTSQPPGERPRTSQAPSGIGFAITRALLRPAVMLWAFNQHLIRAQHPGPSDSPKSYGHGSDPDRILVIGNGFAEGWGVASHELGFPGQLARALPRLTGRGSDIELVLAPDNGGITRYLATTPLRQFDAIVVMCGVDDALRLDSVRGWKRDMRRMLDTLTQETAATATVVMVGMPPLRSLNDFDNACGALAARQALRFNEVTRELCSEVGRADYFELSALGPYSSINDRIPAQQYSDWARDLTDHLAPRLGVNLASTFTAAAHSAKDLRHGPQDETDRQRSLDALNLTDAARAHRLEGIVAAARAILDTQFAALTIIDGDTQWVAAGTKSQFDKTPRVATFCATTIQSDSALVVEDASIDEKFRDLPSVTGQPHLRFYAGYPVESPDGMRIGALCVFDTAPRSSAHVDTDLLRDLAKLIERELAE
jgi:GAF domain